MSDLYLSDEIHAARAARLTREGDLLHLAHEAAERERRRTVRARMACERRATRLDAADAALGDWRARLDAQIGRAS
jgi:hypothetical protein